jgi:hypothetical protein
MQVRMMLQGVMASASIEKAILSCRRRICLVACSSSLDLESHWDTISLPRTLAAAYNPASRSFARPEIIGEFLCP